MRYINSSATLIELVVFSLLFASCSKEFNHTKGLPNLIVNNSTEATRPNIIVIYADDMGFEIPQYTGGQSYQTPNMKFLARNGIQFNQCRALPLCSPSRTELMTGKYSFRNYTGWAQLALHERTFVNDLHDAGYKTCLSGKWDLGGGDVSIRAHGFDTYMQSDRWTQCYKNPKLYVNGTYLSDAATRGKYGQDMMRDFMFRFIDSNLQKPFFIYWAPNLVHEPFSPTPDDPEFATWNPLQQERLKDTIFFPSMIKYVDKQIGQLVNKLRQINLLNRTIIIFAADNGTNPLIHSLWRNQLIKGGKGTTLETGVRVPLVVYWEDHVQPGLINTDLIDICDVYPTINDLAGTPRPSYLIDGISFAPQIFGNAGIKRKWSFCHYDARNTDSTPPVRWVQNKSYKRYDKFGQPTGFYNIVDLEQKLIPDYKFTSKQKTEDSLFRSVLATMRH